MVVNESAYKDAGMGIYVCYGCGALIADREAHDVFHRQLGRTISLANRNKVYR